MGKILRGDGNGGWIIGKRTGVSVGLVAIVIGAASGVLVDRATLGAQVATGIAERKAQADRITVNERHIETMQNTLSDLVAGQREIVTILKTIERERRGTG